MQVKRKRKEHLKTIGMGGIRKTCDLSPWFRGKEFLAFLHVPMPNALRPSFHPLPDSLPTLHHLNLSIGTLWFLP
jgi:hypothetical protein